jgi:tRNA threonylcarbamoyladenosine biosynthesis protein TsaE
MKTYNVNSLADTQKIATELAANAKKGSIFALQGMLGAGKTAFSKAFINALTSSPVEVTSPTFNLLQTYDLPNGLQVWHYDLYRIKSPAEIYELAIDEAFEKAITLIEWPEIISDILPKNTTHITIEFAKNGDENARIVTVSDSL